MLGFMPFMQGGDTRGDQITDSARGQTKVLHCASVLSKCCKHGRTVRIPAQLLLIFCVIGTVAKFA